MSANILSIIFPEDIVNHIMFYVKIDIAPVIAYHFKKFLQRKINNINNMINFAHFTCNLGARMTNYQLFYINRILTPQDVVNTLSSCNCCIRHKKNRPNTVNTYSFDLSNYTPSNHINVSCECPCRHLSRFICKEISTIL